MLNFKELILRGVSNWKDTNADPEAESSDCFRGSNTPLLFNDEFVADSSSHCPRIAMMRRAKVPTDYPKTFKDLASHAYGRAMEALVKELIQFAEVDGLATAEEENFKVQVQNNGQVIYSARPDLVIFMHGIPETACEFKSVQSNGTAEMVFENHEPKLGACIQLAAQMHFHEINRGNICYIQGHWCDGYSFTKKKRLKFEPSFLSFDCEFDSDGWFLFNNKKSIVNKHNLEAAIGILNGLYDEGQLPVQRPRSLKASGIGAYNTCEYCSYGTMKTGICDRAESTVGGLSIENFSDLVKQLLVKGD